MSDSATESCASGLDEDVGTIQDDLAQALKRLANPHTAFACSDRLPTAPNLGLIVEELGMIGLPISDREARVLISKCQKSPVGKGSKTLLDDKVRKSWELNPTQFRISNLSGWQICLEEVVTDLHKRLGVSGPRECTHAELYKLLIYEEGAFFKPHQDTEKAKGMFGTLTISLPSKHTGGEVILSHNNEEFCYASAPDSDRVSATSYASWYASVQHEIKPVLSGYRVVLIYNLVQGLVGSKPKPYIVGSAEANLRRCLTNWERYCESGRHELPYAIHKLSYYYSDHGFSLESLNGDDHAQVSCLQKLCQDLDYDIYFAVLEKVIHKDDEAGDEEFDREECFRNLTTMDGQPVSIRPEYYKEYYLSEPDDTDDEGHDESEHEGWTGNEGAPAQYWYRSVVLLLVPPSCKIAFLLGDDDKYDRILEVLPTLRKRVENGDENALRSLKQYCSAALVDSSTLTQSYSYSWMRNVSARGTQHTSCLKQVAKVCLENGWIDLFGRIPFDLVRSTDVLRAMGDSFAKRDMINSGLPTVFADVQYGNSISEKYRIWQSIAAAFRDACASSERQIEFDKWRLQVLDQIIKSSTNYARADCIALASLSESAGEDMLTTLLKILQHRDTAALTVFMAEVFRSQQGLQSLKASTYFESALESVWDDFSYSLKVAASDQSKPSKVTRGNVGMASQDIIDILHITDHERPDLISVALESLKDAVKDVHEDYLSNELTSLVKAILKHEVPALIPGNNSDIAETVSAIVLEILVLYIRRTVPNEPVKPQDWVLPYRGCCRCDECKQVDSFMIDPVRTKIEIRANEQRRRHLEFEYEGPKYKEPDFNVKTIKDRSPYAWACTKVHRSYNKLAATWRNKVKAAQVTLDSFGGKKRMALKAYLGDNYDAIASCRPEELTSLQVSQEIQPLNELGDSTLNARKRKTAVGEDIGDENELRAKRQRQTLERALLATDVVDLT